MSEADHQRQHRAAAELFDRLALPCSDATCLAWFDGKTRLIIVQIKPCALKQCAQQIPVRFGGYDVIVERMPKAKALAA